MLKVYGLSVIAVSGIFIMRLLQSSFSSLCVFVATNLNAGRQSSVESTKSAVTKEDPGLGYHFNVLHFFLPRFFSMIQNPPGLFISMMRTPIAFSVSMQDSRDFRT